MTAQHLSSGRCAGGWRTSRCSPRRRSRFRPEASRPPRHRRSSARAGVDGGRPRLRDQPSERTGRPGPYGSRRSRGGGPCCVVGGRLDTRPKHRAAGTAPSHWRDRPVCPGEEPDDARPNPCRASDALARRAAHGIALVGCAGAATTAPSSSPVPSPTPAASASAPNAEPMATPMPTLRTAYYLPPYGESSSCSTTTPKEPLGYKVTYEELQDGVTVQDITYPSGGYDVFGKLVIPDR